MLYLYVVGSPMNQINISHQHQAIFRCKEHGTIKQKELRDHMVRYTSMDGRCMCRIEYYGDDYECCQVPYFVRNIKF